MQKILDGKVAIVTGAGDPAGMGASFGRALAEAGATVVIADLKGDGAAAVAAAIASDGNQAAAATVDIASESSVNQMFDHVQSRFGGVDILINNAAVMSELTLDTDLVDYPMEEWHRVFDVNLTGTFLCCRAAAAAMKRRGAGKIVNISSGGAYQLKSAYSISKLGVIGLTMLLADQLARHGINVNSIAPGQVETRAGLSMYPKDSSARARFDTSMRPGKPSDLHGALLFLSSGASDWITGQTIRVDGGWIKRL